MLTLSVLHPFNDKGYCNNSTIFQRSLKKELKSLATFKDKLPYDYRQLVKGWDKFVTFTEGHTIDSITPDIASNTVSISLKPLVVIPEVDWLTILDGGFKDVCTIFGQGLNETIEADIKVEKQAISALSGKYQVSGAPKWTLKKDKKVQNQMNNTQLAFKISRVAPKGSEETDMELGLAADGNVCKPELGVLQTKVQLSNDVAQLMLYRYYADNKAHWSLSPVEGKTLTTIDI